MRRVLLYLTVLPACLLFGVAVNLSYLGQWTHLAGRWLWREHDQYLRWLHWHLCGGGCPHWSKRDE